MKRTVSIFFLLFLISNVLFSFSFSLAEVVSLMKKISTNISKYSNVMDDYHEKFTEFYQTKWVKYYSKFSLEEFDALDSWETDDIYEGQKIDPVDMKQKWKSVFNDPEKLKKEFPNIFYTSHYKWSKEYNKDPAFKKSTDKNIKDGLEYLRNIRSLILLIKNTRDSQKIRGGKVVEMKKYIKNFSMPQGRDELRMGRLIALEVIIDHEIEKQFAELIILINAKSELTIKSSVMTENFRNRNFRSRVSEKGIGSGY